MEANNQYIAKPPVSDAFKNAILKLWIDISSNSIEYRDTFLTNSMDPEQRRVLINNLIELWLQLIPKVVGWKDLESKRMQDLAKKMEQYEKYYYNPALLLDPESGLDLLNFQKDLRFCIESLGITSFEKVD